MSFSHVTNLTDVTVAQSATVSRAVSYNEYSDATAIHIQSPGTMDAGTWTLETSMNGTDWATLNDGSANIGPPGQGLSRQYTELVAVLYWRIKGPTTAADRIFKVSKQWTA